jgi:hypothetical protein
MKHPRDERIGVSAAQAVWHADPRMQALVEDIVDIVAPGAFVETGTMMGWTALWMARRYPLLTIHTVEISEHYHALARENLEGFPNVHRYLGDSAATLRMLVPQLPPVPFFWLDAHPMGAPDQKDDRQPLKEECEAVAACKGPYVCLVDDYPSWGEPSPMLGWCEGALGTDYYRPAYPCHGYALWLRGLDYVPPATMRRTADAAR